MEHNGIMQGITFVDKGKAEWVRESQPECAADTVLLKTMYSGISNGTERNVLMGGNYGGTWPRRIGYQKVSEIVACGERIDRFRVGDLVFTGTFTGHVEYHLARCSNAPGWSRSIRSSDPVSPAVYWLNMPGCFLLGDGGK
jgi:NADPH:quinone reductase-like Zn-dependent oxidoreductase